MQHLECKAYHRVQIFLSKIPTSANEPVLRCVKPHQFLPPETFDIRLFPQVLLKQPVPIFPHNHLQRAELLLHRFRQMFPAPEDMDCAPLQQCEMVLSHNESLHNPSILKGPGVQLLRQQRRLVVQLPTDAREQRDPGI